VSSLRAFAKRILPLPDPRMIAPIRRVRDARTWPLAFHPGKRRQSRADFQHCRTLEDYFAFARDALAGGALRDPDQDGLGLGISHWSSSKPLPALESSVGG
jgi:hypothetical protein